MSILVYNVKIHYTVACSETNSTDFPILSAQAKQRLPSAADTLCNLLFYQMPVVMQLRALRSTCKWVQCLRSVVRPTRSFHRSALSPSSLYGSRHVGPRQSSKAFEAIVTPQSMLCRTSSSYATSVTPDESIEVDIMVEGSNEVLDRCHCSTMDSDA